MTDAKRSSLRDLPDTVEIDRRRAVRVRCALQVGLTGQNTLYAGLANDISQGGIFVALPDPPAVGLEFDLALQLDDGAPPLLVRGRVQWRRERGPLVDGPSGVGIQFLDLEMKSLVRLVAAMERHETLLWEP